MPAAKASRGVWPTVSRPESIGCIVGNGLDGNGRGFREGSFRNNQLDLAVCRAERTPFRTDNLAAGLAIGLTYGRDAIR